MGKLCARLSYEDTDPRRAAEVLGFLLSVLTDLDRAHEALSDQYFVT
jgi:hypothetical protein